MKILGYQTRREADLFPLIEGKELEEFCADIEKSGLLEEIVLFEGKILDGRNRARACEKLSIKPRFVQWKPAYEGQTPVDFVLSKNLHRRQLTESQRGMLGADSDDLNEIQAKAIERRMSNLKKGAKKDAPESASMRSRDDEPVGKTSEKIAEKVGASARYVEMAKAIKKKNPELAEKVRTGELSIPKAEKIIKKAELVQHARVYLPPEGEYSVIVIDDPWPYEDALDGSDAVRGGLTYPSMTIDELCAVKIPAAADAVLFMWITNAHLLEGSHLPVLKARGFKAKYLVTWNKQGRIGTGRVMRNQTEHVIIAVKGKPVLNATVELTLQESTAGSTVFDGKKQIQHSRKPEEFFALVDKLCPSLSRIEMFARQRRPGWVAWGIEADKFEPAKVGAVDAAAEIVPTATPAALDREMKIRGFNYLDGEGGITNAECHNCGFTVEISGLVTVAHLEEIREHTCAPMAATQPRASELSTPEWARAVAAEVEKPGSSGVSFGDGSVLEVRPASEQVVDGAVATKGVCINCKCTNEKPCAPTEAEPAPCAWVNEDESLCTHCVAPEPEDRPVEKHAATLPACYLCSKPIEGEPAQKGMLGAGDAHESCLKKAEAEADELARNGVAGTEVGCPSCRAPEGTRCVGVFGGGTHLTRITAARKAKAAAAEMERAQFDQTSMAFEEPAVQVNVEPAAEPASDALEPHDAEVVPCPESYCLARSGEPCVTASKSGNRSPHATRIKFFEKVAKQTAKKKAEEAGGEFLYEAIEAYRAGTDVCPHCGIDRKKNNPGTQPNSPGWLYLGVDAKGQCALAICGRCDKAGKPALYVDAEHTKVRNATAEQRHRGGAKPPKKQPAKPARAARAGTTKKKRAK